MNKRFLVYVIFIAIFTLHSALYAAFIAIVDAGSSGSRIHLFDIRKIKGTVQFEIIPLKNNKTSPGVSKTMHGIPIRSLSISLRLLRV